MYGFPLAHMYKYIHVYMHCLVHIHPHSFVKSKKGGSQNTCKEKARRIKKHMEAAKRIKEIYKGTIKSLDNQNRRKFRD